MAGSQDRFLRSLLAASPFGDVVGERVRRRHARIDAAGTAGRKLLATFDYLRSMAALAARFDRAGADLITEAAIPAVRVHADAMAQLADDRIQELTGQRTPLMQKGASALLIRRLSQTTTVLGERVQSGRAAIDAAVTADEKLFATFRYLRSLTAQVARFNPAGADLITEAATGTVRVHADALAQLMRSYSQEVASERTCP